MIKAQFIFIELALILYKNRLKWSIHKDIIEER